MSNISTSSTGPKWFPLTKKLVGFATTFVCGMIMAFGKSADAPILLIIKLSQSFITETADSIIAYIYSPLDGVDQL